MVENNDNLTFPPLDLDENPPQFEIPQEEQVSSLTSNSSDPLTRVANAIKEKIASSTSISDNQQSPNEPNLETPVNPDTISDMAPDFENTPEDSFDTPPNIISDINENIIKEDGNEATSNEANFEIPTFQDISDIPEENFNPSSEISSNIEDNFVEPSEPITFNPPAFNTSSIQEEAVLQPNNISQETNETINETLPDIEPDTFTIPSNNEDDFSKLDEMFSNGVRLLKEKINKESSQNLAELAKDNLTK